MQNAVLHWALELKCCSCSRNCGFKGPDLKIWKIVVIDCFNAPSLDLTRGKKKKHLQ